MRLLALSVVALALVAPAPVATAQSTPSATPDVAPAPGPRVSAARVGISPLARRDVTVTPAPILQSQESRRRSGQMLTIIGGAIFVAGLIIDDDVGTIVALGGLGLGIYGLLQWLQASASGLASP
jgi:hypothetical protein